VTAVVTGASGFIGSRLVKSLAGSGVPVRALTRRTPPKDMVLPGVTWIVGDLVHPDTWEKLLEPGCTVFNLAYTAGAIAADAIGMTERMVEYCAAGRISRLVHCSTVSVYGQVRGPVATETTECRPNSAYGDIKLRLERILTEKIDRRFECAILRPTSVFGAGGPALIKMMADLIRGRRSVSYLRSSLFGYRRAHLVPIETVVAALIHLSKIPLYQTGDCFIVSDDRERINSFRGVERIVMEELDIPYYSVPPVTSPRIVLELLLFAMRRPNANTRVVYSSEKLLGTGFTKPVVFDQALRRFVRDHASKNIFVVP
jgi:nucleoside-diphosphate-sugar epimerase